MYIYIYISIFDFDFYFMIRWVTDLYGGKPVTLGIFGIDLRVGTTLRPTCAE